MVESVTAQESAIEAEYLATQTGVAVLDLSRAGKLEISGRNAIQFLNGLVTNDIKSLAPGNGLLAAFLNVQGKVLALARIYRRESSFLLEIDESNREKVFANLSRFVPAGEFQVTDVSAELALISLQGPQSATLLTSLVGDTLGSEPFSHIEGDIGDTHVHITRHSRFGRVGFDVFLPSGQLQQVWDRVLTAGTAYGARPVSAAVLEVARIAAGVPREPQDVNQNHILLEAGLDEAVSYTKGCYLGQEIIARIHWRGQPAKRLRRLRIKAERVPAAGTELIASDGKRVGEITSAAAVPSGTEHEILALGYVHRYYLAERTRFDLRVDGCSVGEAELVA